MSEPDKFEDDLLYALTRTGEGFRTEQADLVAGGYRRGRSRWRRRSTAAVVGGAAALALVGTGAVYLGSLGGKETGTVSAASAPAATAGSATAAATPTTAKSSAPAVVSGDEVLATFQALLPKGETSEANGRGTDDEWLDGTFASASVVFDDGQGKSLVQIGIQKHHPKQAQVPTCPSDFKLARVDSCSATTLPDGSKLLLEQGYEYSDGRADTKEWHATLTGPDGRSISLSEWNAPKEKGAPDSRPNPPLTLDQLKAIVTDRSWDRVVAAVRYDGIDEEAVDPGLSLPDREAVLAGLLPPGVTVTGRSGTALAATFQLAQGQAAGSLMLRVENWAHSGSVQGERAFKDANTLPDGSRILVNGDPDGKEKPLTVNVLRPDGMEVLVYQMPTGKPLLTADQVKAIATSPAWKVYK
ncbi:hypothetical protein [Streptomyces sp. LS1784]|uniref:hypothetical protein n=1 Tax=Streptomyces sp. LS1784 TaxID=2851533 RepID=UPI001CC9BEF9|nr:hypothetical protein [Streptomyces sp. LS1784]